MRKIYVSLKRIWPGSLIPLLLFICLPASATNYPFSATYSGTNEVPPNNSTATGTIHGVYNDFTNTIYYTIVFSGLSSNTSNAHFHGPAAVGVGAGVLIGHAGFPLGVTSGVYAKSDVLTDAQETMLLAGLIYSNIHTTNFQGGEIRAQIILGAASNQIYSIQNTYSGAQEVPPNPSPGTGTITGAYNSATNTIYYSITFSGLDSNTTAAHFHGPAAPGVGAGVVKAHTGFPVGVESGNFSRADTLTDAQETDLLAGLWYSNIHTQKYQGGEIRAQITPLLPPDITCPANITQGNDPGLCSASVTFSATATGIPTPTIEYRIGTTVITSPHVFPVGTATVWAKATNTAGVDSCSFVVTVNDIEPPVIAGLLANPDMLWPPNHKMRDVTVNYTSTDNCGVVSCVMTVTSNEPDNGTGDGNTTDDWELVDGHHVKLRAERAGNGSCRIYTIKITCTDQHGNSSDSSTHVIVPHDMSSAGTCVIPRGGGRTGGRSLLRRNLQLSALPNPSPNTFTLDIRSTVNTERASIRIIDMFGRVVESRDNVQVNQLIQVGAGLRGGLYIVQLRQGGQTEQLQIFKLD